MGGGSEYGRTGGGAVGEEVRKRRFQVERGGDQCCNVNK